MVFCPSVVRSKASSSSISSPVSLKSQMSRLDFWRAALTLGWIGVLLRIHHDTQATGRVRVASREVRRR